MTAGTAAASNSAGAEACAGAARAAGAAACCAAGAGAALAPSGAVAPNRPPGSAASAPAVARGVRPSPRRRCRASWHVAAAAAAARAAVTESRPAQAEARLLAWTKRLPPRGRRPAVPCKVGAGQRTNRASAAPLSLLRAAAAVAAAAVPGATAPSPKQARRSGRREAPRGKHGRGVPRGPRSCPRRPGRRVLPGRPWR